MMVRGTLLLLLLFCLLSDLSWRSLSAAAPVPVPAPAPPAAGGSESVQAATAIPVLVSCDSADQNFLLEFKGALDNGDAKLADWLNDRSCCVWPGVDCSVNSTGSETQGGLAGSLSQDQRRVRHLRLPGMGLTGRVSNLTWANLSTLLSLDLSFNNLTGPLPAGLAQLEVLEKLSLGSNNFSGGVDVLADCRSLLELDVSNNNLSGALPSTFASSNLEKLDLSGNKFEGPWPGLSNMDNLQVLNVSHNNVTAGMPVFRNCSALREIDLSQNGFSGTLETDICALKPNLLLLNVSENALAGDLPSSISLCSSLETLDLGYNSLGGALPPAIFDLGNLTNLCLPNNQFVGVLGPAIANLTNLRRVLLSTNNFTGAIPAEVGMLKKLERLDLSFNSLRGGIPPELSNCTQLISFAVRRNGLVGPIELAFDKLPALTMLDMSFNNLSGEIPSTISLCSELQSLSLSSNNLTGSIPPQLGGLKKLVSLALSNNNLAGGIPTELDGCTSLVSLILTKNPSLGGEVPANMSALPNLQLLAIGVCGLDGSIPDWIGNCSKLQLLDLSWNNFTGQLPGWISTLEYLIYLDLSNNSLSGFLPVNLSASPSFSGQQVNASGLVEVTTLVLFVTRNVTAGPQRYTRLSGFPPSLILAYNEFYGFIPPEYGKLQKVMALDLSHNRLSGHIPDTLSNMSSLYSLNLADNILSGNIPPSFSALNFLALFNVSNNNLSGPIPDGTQFSSFSELSFLNNPFLCGSPLERKCDGQPVQVPADAIVSKKQDGFSKKAILGLTIGVGLGMAVVLALLTRCLLYRRQERQPTEEEEESEYTEGMVSFSVDLYLNDQLSKLSPADLVKATNNFDQSNIIGCGGFGLVFRATLSDGTHVAIKRLSGDTGQAEREVQAELLTLGQIQHRNLVALQGYCRFGSDRLLIYNYMENGSLDYWLHERTDGGLKLDWPMRRKIALGTARGLAYLHQMCEPHIVHRDIKSSNILLNEKFEAHLCDFGLARHLANTDTHVTTELVGTLGYIPPEYGQAWIATLRGDVYSFGVVVLELLTRRRPVEVSRKKGVADLVSWVQDMRIKGTPEEVFDVLLKHQGYENEMLQVLEVAIMCVNHSPQKRPTIRDVEYMLEQVGKDPADKEAKNPADLFV